MRVTFREQLVALTFVAPAVLLIGLFVVWPTISMVISSVVDGFWSTRVAPEFVGARHYRDVVSDPRFGHSVLNTLLFTIIVVPVQATAALLLAAWVNGAGASRRLLRAAIFLPTTLSLVVLCILWALLYAEPGSLGAGLFNGLLIGVGLPPVPFLTSEYLALPSLALMSIWQGVGLQMLIFLSALQQIPNQLYEAAELDGAGRSRRFWYVTLPGVAPTAAFVVMITTIFALKLFAQPYIMTKGGPNNSTRSVVQYVYEALAKEQNLGLACAAAVLLFAGVLVVSIVQRLIARRVEDVV